jgi:hypothetical protein
MSEAMEPSPHLLSMPNEILTNICAYAVDDGNRRGGKCWLQAVRLTCKQLYPPATTEFGKRFLTRLPVMAARGSLEALLKICENPLIGPHVIEIKLYGCRVDQKLVSPLRRNLESRFRERDLQGIRQARHRLQLFMDFLEEEVELEQHVGIFQLLVNAFKAIRSYGNSIGLTVFTDSDAEYPRGVLGEQEAIEQLSEDSASALWTMISRESVRPSFKTLFAAVAKSGCCMDRLEFIDSEYWYEPASTQREKNNSLTSPAVSVLLDVKALCLDFTCDLLIDNLDEFFNTILRLTKNLESLCVKQNSFPSESFLWAEADSFGRTIKSFTSDRLRRIELDQASCRQADLISMLRRHKATMTYFCLSEFGLVGSWEEVMIWIRDNCSLASLRMDALYEYYEEEDIMLSAEPNGFRGDIPQLTEFLEQQRKE